MFTQSDMDDSNFGLDENGRTVLMDFSEIGVLPDTLRGSLIETVSQNDYDESSVVRAVVRVVVQAIFDFEVVDDDEIFPFCRRSESSRVTSVAFVTCVTRALACLAQSRSSTCQT